MLSFLLDEQISPEIARQVGLKRPEIPIVSVHLWRQGQFMATQDEKILIAAFSEKMTLVTYDQKTIMPIVTEWAQIGTSHGGIIFVDERTIFQGDFGALVRSLIAQWDLDKDRPWANAISFLKDQP